MTSGEFVDFVSRLKNRLFRISLFFVKNTEDAEDIAQEVFLKLWKIRDEWSKYQSLEGLAVHMTKNLSLNRIKSRKRVMTSENGEMELVAISSHEEGFEWKEKLEWVHKAIDALPDQQKLVVQLKGVEGLETKEIAKLMDETDNHVRVILSRARKNIRKAYQKIYYHES